MAESYRAFFTRITGNHPYPYQEKLGTDPWPGVLDIPTGLGKTAGVVVAWLWKRLSSEEDTPRRLVYCLPMRVLVEQTVEAVREWCQMAERDFGTQEVDGERRVAPSVHTLMGGALDVDWRREPESDAVLVGTQDMLISRALMRGYGMSRYQWAVDYALLHNDALWAFDEVQLMGPALATSAQLEAFRRDLGVARRSRSLWMSATLQPDWLATVDLGERVRSLPSLSVSEEDRGVVRDRLGARKGLVRSGAFLAGSSKAAISEYLNGLRDEILDRHVPGSQTLVILNRVDRAQQLFKLIQKQEPAADVLLLHARFRAGERREIEQRLRAKAEPGTGRIVVATQAVEAGIDITSTTLFTELAPWSSMVQRFGRCNRYGEVSDGATVAWIDLQQKGKGAAPYAEADFEASRKILEGGLQDVGPGSLPPVSAERPLTQVVRRRDLLDLFNTDPDLSGFDIDVSPFIRDVGSPQVQVFWREIDEKPPPDEPRPSREELCPVSMGQIRDYLGRKPGWVWDALGEQWRKVGAKDALIPGTTLLLDAAEGGYDEALGFDPSAKAAVVPLPPQDDMPSESADDDEATRVRRFVVLSDHLLRVRERAKNLAAALALDERDGDRVTTAASWHDVGKAHPAFQAAMLDAASEHAPADANTLWAKSPGKGRPKYRIDGDPPQRRSYFRHELASMLVWLANGEDGPDSDLIAYLILAHHGKVRMGLRALPTEPLPPDNRLVARGVWDGDELPPVEVDGRMLPATTLRLDLMRLGRGAMGASWVERTQELLEDHGPFRLAWLESLVRIADWRSSAEEDSDGS